MQMTINNMFSNNMDNFVKTQVFVVFILNKRTHSSLERNHSEYLTSKYDE